MKLLDFNNMKYFVLIISLSLLLAMLGVLIKYLNKRAAKNYKPTIKYIKQLLQQVTNGTAIDSKWDEFIFCPINYNAELEKVRIHCKSISFDTRYTQGDESKIIFWFNQNGIIEIKKQIQYLDTINKKI